MTRSHDGSPGPGLSPDRRLLLLAFAATFLSRTVAGAVVESLRAELWLTDQALGTLASAFAGTYAIGLPAGAVLSARRGRAGLLAAGLALCGVATAASAAAFGFWTLIAARLAAGAGAGLAAGLAVVLLVDGEGPPRAPPRGLMLPAGTGLALGYLLGGLCGRWPGWRGAFVISGAALLALAAGCLRAAEPPRRAGDPWASLRGEGLPRALRRLVRDPDRSLAVLAAIAAACAVSALSFWLPAFLERTRGVPRLFAGAQLGVAVLGSGFAGAALGRAGVRRRASSGGAAALTAAAGSATAALGMAAALLAAAPALVLPSVMVALLGTFAAARGMVSALESPGGSDAAALAIVLLLVLGAGELGGAFGLGAVADRVSFGRALFLLPGSLAASAILWAAAWARARRAQRGERSAYGGQSTGQDTGRSGRQADC